MLLKTLRLLIYSVDMWVRLKWKSIHRNEKHSNQSLTKSYMNQKDLKQQRKSWLIDKRLDEQVLQAKSKVWKLLWSNLINKSEVGICQTLHQNLKKMRQWRNFNLTKITATCYSLIVLETQDFWEAPILLKLRKLRKLTERLIFQKNTLTTSHMQLWEMNLSTNIFSLRLNCCDISKLSKSNENACKLLDQIRLFLFS